MKSLIKNIGACFILVLLTSISSADDSAYSFSSSAMDSMEQQLRTMLKKKLIKTPEVNPDKALPAITLKIDAFITNDINNTNTYDSNGNSSPGDFFGGLILAAKNRTFSKVKYDGSYRYINYPMGDVAPNRGVCTDVVIRAYRKLDVDLQQLVHEDIKKNFHLYPSRRRWGNIEADPNIDHRRVYNLQVFFERYAESLALTTDPTDYLPGDLVTWRLGPKMPHIGIIVDEYSKDYPDQPLVVHNIGAGPKQEDILFSYPITGHYRYKPGISKPPATSLLVKKSRNTRSSLKTRSRNKSSVNSLVEAAYFLLP